MQETLRYDTTSSIGGVEGRDLGLLSLDKGVTQQDKKQRDIGVAQNRSAGEGAYGVNCV